MEFEVLKDLVRVITRNKVKQIEVLGNAGQESSRLEQLYEGVSKGKFNSDDEAARFFFKTNEKDPNYRKLRNRLVRQLINTSFFIDVQQPMFNERGKAFYNCYRDFSAAYILIARDARNAGLYLLQQVLEQSIKFEFTELTAEIAREVRIRYSRTLNDQSGHEKIAELHREYEAKRRAETDAFDYYENLLNHYIVRRSANKEVHEFAALYFEELLPQASKVDTLQFYYYTYIIGIIKFFSINDCENALKLCNEALDILLNRKSTNRGHIVSLYFQKMSCLTQLRIFDDGQGEETFNSCFDLVDEGDHNWFIAMGALFHYRLYARRYEDAFEIYAKAVSHQRFSLLHGSARDSWKLYGGYLHLLAALGKLDPAKVETVAGTLKLTRFTNDFTVMDKEKEGMNIPLVLLPVLYSFAKGETQEYGRSTEALEKYRQRYLDNDMNRRSSSFVRLLMALSKRPFEPESAEKKIKKELAVLAQETPQLAGQSAAIEIIPYEDLWGMLDGNYR